jgi:hypothetical protein
VFLQCREGVGGAAESCHCVRRVLCGACGRYVVVSDDGSGEKCAHAREKAELCDLGMWLGFLGSFPPPPPRFWMSLKPASSCITTFFVSVTENLKRRPHICLRAMFSVGEVTKAVRTAHHGNALGQCDGFYQQVLSIWQL